MTKKELNSLLEEIKNVEMREIIFSTGTGGFPDYNKKLEKDIVEADEKFQYETPDNGNAYSGWVKIICSKTKYVDHYGDVIYISRSGFIFTEHYEEGSPSDFDKCTLDTPDIRIDLDYFNINEYLKNNESKSFLKNKELFEEINLLNKFIKSIFNKPFTNLNMTQERTLILIKINSLKTIGEINKMIGIRKGSFTNLIDILIEKNLVKRKKSNKDKRKVFLILTKEGENLTKELINAMDKHIDKIFNNSKQELLKLIKLINNLNNSR